MSTLGFSSVLHLLTSTPVCEVERPTGLGDWLVFRRGGPRPKGEVAFSLSLSLSLSSLMLKVVTIYYSPNEALSRCDLITCFHFINYHAVADNHQFLHEAYVSDDLVRAIHRFMKRYPKGIPLVDFTAKFEVELLCMLTH